MKKKYISVDVEASGLTPGKYSMLSLGACLVDNIRIKFYRELKPISPNFNLASMRIGCLGLRCLEDLKHTPQYNPKSKHFRPDLVLEVLEGSGAEPSEAMADFAEWIKTNTNGYKPIEAAAPIKFDGMFTAWYFDNFYKKKNPLGYSGEDMNSFYRGLVKNQNARMKDLKLKDERRHPHNSLEDAIQQAKIFRKVLDLMKSS